METIGQLHAQEALPMGKELPPAPTAWEAGWVPEPIWTKRLRKEKKNPFTDPATNRTLVAQPVAKSIYRSSYPGSRSGKTTPKTEQKILETISYTNFASHACVSDKF